ncbi:MAG TPA: hypothetical protein VGG74_33735 [Kofleriaceae bacterium]|jgi:hypothetical protein
MRVLSNVVVVVCALLGGAAIAGTGTTSPTPAPPPAPAPASVGSDAAAAGSDVKPEDMPTAIRMRRLEEQTQALKERTWQLKARIQMLKEQMLGGGVGAQAVITHDNDMGSSFRLIKLVYTLDGTQVLSQTDDTGESLYKVKSFDVLNGPIAPGNHTLTMVATYRGHGYGVFEYLQKFTFTARNTSSFTASEGKISKVDCRGYEKSASLPMEKRSAIDCAVTELEPDKPSAPTQATPGSTPLPASPPAAATPAGK